MTPKEIVLSGYQAFSQGDIESLGKLFHEDAVIRVNGNHKRSGEYKGFMRMDCLVIPMSFPKS